MPKPKKKKKKKILWIEDEKDLIDLYVIVLKKVSKNLEVEFMQLGQQAIDRVKEIEEGKAEKPDLIMLDLLLPDINGDRVCEAIRKSPATRDISVFVFTNYGGEQMQVKMTEELKVEKYLVKTEWVPSRLVPLLKKTLGIK